MLNHYYNNDLDKSYKHLPIYATTNEYGRYIEDALNVNLLSANGTENDIGYVVRGENRTINMPDNCGFGIREVYAASKSLTNCP